MNTVLLHPTDILFFRDGRPMSGASAGHGAAWPLPSVINLAFHAALHRSEMPSHEHRIGRSGKYTDKRERKFGSLVTAGPFPVSPSGGWYFPKPADAQDDGAVLLRPHCGNDGASSLPSPCRYPVVSAAAPTKEKAKPWWSSSLWEKYLGRGDGSGCLTDSDFSTTEHSYGIGIDPETGTQDGVRIYSAHYLRLKASWSLGVLAHAPDKEHGGEDIVSKLIHHDQMIITGGQQRICTAELLPNETLPLPRSATITGTRVKWILLTPAIFPAINDHPGGWLPSWVDLKGNVQLLDGPGKNYAQRHNVAEGKPIQAQLVAALVGKPVPVTGYALPHEAADRADGGAKPTHLAVPAGSVYYFECPSPEAAKKLATALSWHGETPGTQIKNRRSTLMGEKGFGLGVCGSWEFHNGRSSF